MSARTRRVIAVRRPEGGHWVGDGFPVRTLLSYDDLGERLSPFLLLDFAGPAEFPPTQARLGVGRHPHRGFETVTIVFRGMVEHGDTVGNHGVIGPGDVQWMTAGRGILHEEFHAGDFARSGGTFHVIQLWVNLPKVHKMTAPRYQALLDADIPVVPLDGAGSARVIAGSLRGVVGAAKTFTPVDVWDVALREGGAASLEVPAGRNAFVVGVEGRLAVDGHVVEVADVAVLDPEDAGPVGLRAERGPARALVLHGEPLGEPIAGYGPFVMNTREEIGQAISDLHLGRFA
jgi:redox-sensitive bicupin YhaK (pirin superfamily)